MPTIAAVVLCSVSFLEALFYCKDVMVVGTLVVFAGGVMTYAGAAASRLI